MTSRNRRSFAKTALIAMTASLLADPSLAQDYPKQPINFVVGFAPGGFADVSARVVAEHVAGVLGQPVAVENRGGAASNIAASYVAGMPADGYTVLATTTAIAVNATLYKNLEYALFEDLVPVGVALEAPELFAVHPSQPTNLADFLKAAHDTGGKSFGSAGTGTGSHLTFASFFDNLAKAPVNHVPFQGAGPANQAVLGGHTDGFAGSASGPVVALIRDGGIVCVGVAAPERYREVPDCPTLGEQGYPDHFGASWLSFWVPDGTPEPVREALNSAIRSISDNEAMSKALSAHGVVMKKDLGETEAFLKDQIKIWGERVEASGITVE